MAWLRLIIELAALILGLCYLYAKRLERMGLWRPKEDPTDWTGHGIDTSGLQPRMEEVRRDHMAGCRGAIDFGFHRALIGFARKAVSQLGYFRKRQPEGHAHQSGT